MREKVSDKPYMRLLIFSFVFLSACNAPKSFSSWLNQWKDYSLTRLASSADRGLNEEERDGLFALYNDLLLAENCSQIQSYLEDDPVLLLFQKSLNLPRGFLFDVFVDNYSYELSLIKRKRSAAEQVAFTVVSAWKTQVSLEDIKYVITKAVKCYPDEYV